MEKAESLSFPTVPGSGGRGESLHDEILVGTKRLNCHCPSFLLSFIIGFSILIHTHSYHILRRVYANLTSHHKKNTPEPCPMQWKSRRTKACMLSHPPGVACGWILGRERPYHLYSGCGGMYVLGLVLRVNGCGGMYCWGTNLCVCV